MYFFNRVLLHFGWNAWSHRRIIYRTLSMMVSWLIGVIGCSNSQIILASLECRWLVCLCIFLTLSFNSILQFCVNRIFVSKIALVTKITYATVRRTRIWCMCWEGSLILKSKLESLIFNHLFSSLLNDKSLLSNTQVLEIFETYA